MAGKDMVPVISKRVTIDGEDGGEDGYCLEIVPKASTKLVMKEKEDLSANLDLPGLVGDLHKLGSFVRVAYYGVAGNTDLQIKVQQVGFTVAKLCQESDVTVVLFKKACTEVIETLQTSYQFLVDGLEDIAVDNLHSLADVAGKMATHSNDLMKKFEDAEKMVQGTLTETRIKKDGQEIYKKEMQKRQEEEKLKAEQEEEKQMAAREAQAEKKVLYLTADAREQNAEELLGEVIKKKSGLAHRLFQAVKTGVKRATNLDISDEDAYVEEIENERRRAAQAREERLQFLKETEAQREAQLNATLQLKECVLRISQCKPEEGLADAAIPALYGAQGALSAITVIMMQASKFWRMMHEHCKEMANAKMMNLIEMTMKKSEEKRLKVWGSPSFIQVGVRYYAKWVALEDVCKTYRDEIRGAEQQMYLFMKENPTTEEAREKLPELARVLKADLEDAIAKMKKRGDDNKKEIEQKTKDAITDEAKAE